MKLHHLAAVGALPAALAAPAAAPAQEPAPTARVGDASLGYGERLVVTGRAPAALVTLELRPAGETGFAPVASALAGSDGRYRLALRLSRSGTVRTRVAGVPSPERRVRVAARVGTRKRRLD
ncbi:MAG: hypothetical protein M3P39_09030, partial [Actinomycetota bacterium]|nr:hypothetical protein [Actinomycetota bacterium]